MTSITNFLRRHFIGALVVSVLIGAAIIAGGIGYLFKTHFDKLLDTYQAQVVAGCQRLNVKQTQDNRNQYADYTFDRVFIELIELPMPQQTTKQRRYLRIFLAPLVAADRAKAWVPLVEDCSSVGVHYKLPKAIPFYQQLPPKSALNYP